MRFTSKFIQCLGLIIVTFNSIFASVIALPSVSKFKPTLNPNILLALQENVFPPNDQFKINDAVLTSGIPLTIRFPSQLYTLPASFEDRSRQILQQSLPQTLQQFNVPADQIQGRVNEGIPLFVSGIQDLLNSDQPGSNLRRRGILDSIFGWAKDAGCALVAAGGLPLFLLAATDFTAENTDASSTSPEQDFFLYPVWGNLAHDGPVKIYYQATRAPFFKGTSGTTFNRNVFTALSPVPSFSESNFYNFEYLVQTLIHEFTHVDQYRRHGYDITSFGYEYLFQWCSNGGYTKITLEVDAYATQHKVDGLLLFDAQNQLGNQFFQVWRTQNLGPSLGNPIAQAYTTASTSVRELPFQLGLLQIQDGPCFRTFNNAEVSARASSTCNPNAQCNSNNRRDARQPVNSGPDDPGLPGPRIPCSPDEKAAARQECQKNKAAWAAVSNRGWTCNLNLPIPGQPRPPPTQKPGCPAGCSIITLIPITAHSCQNDDPPPGCDHESAAAANAACRPKLAFCSSP